MAKPIKFQGLVKIFAMENFPSPLHVSSADGTETIIANSCMGHVTAARPSIGRGTGFIDVAATDEPMANVSQAEDSSYSVDMTAYHGVMSPLSVERATMEWLARAMSTDDECRPEMCGILLTREGAVATDGHRLHHADAVWTGEDLFLPTLAVEVILWGLKNKATSIEVGSDNGKVYLSMTGEGWSCRAVTHATPRKYPDWREVFDNGDPSAKAPVRDLGAQVPKSKKDGSKTPTIVFGFKNCGGFGTVSAVQVGTVADGQVASFGCETNGSGELALCREYLRDAIGDGYWTLRLFADRMVAIGEGRKSVVMAMRI